MSSSKEFESVALTRGQGHLLRRAQLAETNVVRKVVLDDEARVQSDDLGKLVLCGRRERVSKAQDGKESIFTSPRPSVTLSPMWISSLPEADGKVMPASIPTVSKLSGCRDEGGQRQLASAERSDSQSTSLNP